MAVAPILATGMAARLRSQWDREDGLGQNHKAVKFLGQDYDSLRDQCLRSGRLFEDSFFPCAASSLGFQELGPRSSKISGVRWMRPTVSWLLTCGMYSHGCGEDLAKNAQLCLRSSDSSIMTARPCIYQRINDCQRMKSVFELYRRRFH